MGLFDDLLSQVAGSADAKNLAAKVGLTPEQVERAAIALGQAHPQPGDTVAAAADRTGLPQDALGEIVHQLGGEGALGRFSHLIEAKGGAGIGDMLGGLAGNLFGNRD